MATEVEGWRRTEDMFNSRKRGVVTDQNHQIQKLRCVRGADMLLAVL
jgi:hypothetical protein